MGVGVVGGASVAVSPSEAPHPCRVRGNAVCDTIICLPENGSTRCKLNTRTLRHTRPGASRPRGADSRRGQSRRAARAGSGSQGRRLGAAPACHPGARGQRQRQGMRRCHGAACHSAASTAGSSQRPGPGEEEGRTLKPWSPPLTSTRSSSQSWASCGSEVSPGTASLVMLALSMPSSCTHPRRGNQARRAHSGASFKPHAVHGGWECTACA